MTIQIDQSYIDGNELVITGYMRVFRDDDPTSQRLFDILKSAIEEIIAAQFAVNPEEAP